MGAGNLVLVLERPTGCACSTNVHLGSKETCSALRSGYGPHSAERATLKIVFGPLSLFGSRETLVLVVGSWETLVWKKYHVRQSCTCSASVKFTTA